MREITTHHTNVANRAITIDADAPDPENGNASHQYMIATHPWTPGDPQSIERDGHEWLLLFQRGPIAEVGVNGITNEVLLAIVVDRLEGFQSSRYACTDNANALAAVRGALHCLECRTKERAARGVEGTHKL